MVRRQTAAGTVALLEEALQSFPCEKRQMFGCPVYFVNGAMFAGVHNDRIFLRLDAADRQQLLTKEPAARPFEPLPGRVMREYAVLPEALAADNAALDRWLALAHAYVAALPSKQAMSRKHLQGEGL